MQERLAALWPTLAHMSVGSVACLIFSFLIVACAIYLMRTQWFEEGAVGRFILLLLICTALINPIEVYVYAGSTVFDFAYGTVAIMGGVAALMLWLAGVTFLDSKRARRCHAYHNRRHGRFLFESIGTILDSREEPKHSAHSH